MEKVTHDPSSEIFSEEILAIQYPINFVCLRKLFCYRLPCPKIQFIFATT